MLFYLGLLCALGVTISQTDEKMEVPVDEFDGKVTYGEKRKQEGMIRLSRYSINSIILYISIGIERSYRYISINRSRLSSNGKTCSNIVLRFTQ